MIIFFTKNKLCDQLPCDFLKQIVSHFQRTNLGSSSEFKATSLLDLAKYNYLTGDNREARLTKVSEGVVRRALGLSHPGQYKCFASNYNLVPFTNFYLRLHVIFYEM